MDDSFAVEGAPDSRPYERDDSASSMTVDEQQAAQGCGSGQCVEDA
jgi:hypothetical protein